MTNEFTNILCTAFLGDRAVASGPINQVVSIVKDDLDSRDTSQLLIFDDSTGRPVDVDFRGTKDDVLKRLLERLKNPADPEENQPSPRRVGRPKLGVVAGEVTLLPRHWEWLKSQPGGASVTLRKLIDEARHAREKQDQMREAQESTYRFMTAMAGNFHQYEEALRALYAGDAERFYHLMDDWAPDIRDHIKKLATNAFPTGETAQ